MSNNLENMPTEEFVLSNLDRCRRYVTDVIYHCTDDENNLDLMKVGYHIGMTQQIISDSCLGLSVIKHSNYEDILSDLRCAIGYLESAIQSTTDMETGEVEVIKIGYFMGLTDSRLETTIKSLSDTFIDKSSDTNVNIYDDKLQKTMKSYNKSDIQLRPHWKETL
jgi:hypothetical protein